MEIGSGIGILKRFLLFSVITLTALILSSCVLVKDNTKPIISDFTRSATLLSQHMIHFQANIRDTGSGLEEVAFELNHSPLPVTKEGSDLFVANWFGVYGSYSITVLAQDKAGNMATKTDSFFVADSTPPIVEAQLPLKVAKDVEFPLSIKAYDLQSGVKNVSLEIDGESVPVSNNETLKWSFSSEGKHTVSLTAINNQGLITTKEIDVDVINERKVPPYVQFVTLPQTIKSDKNTTFDVYAYSPNGIKKVELKVYDTTELSYFPSKNNVYEFHISIHPSTSKLVEATCTVYDSVGVKKVLAEPIVALSNDSSNVVIFPDNLSVRVAKEKTYAKIPFFVGSSNQNLKVKAYIDGVPADVEGSLPEMFALWKPSTGIHLLAVSVNGKIIKEKQFSLSLPSKEATSSSLPKR
jgi:PKD repeat protein